ncbi:hypothetical protein P691DRAFT_777703 [Macrolepiota fuliginosa MF-IS2]|uniref:DUF6534 domain-containing protein n=1 Tax=Macrolepiota fuliginosa MF-IS2 TaxID=1400762 RepID=A0A9P5X8E6_9AGAR|nr:hypothetical protein P691DRAFT_777703 [Macrolepiota fuliginosa MF-IS2]
MYSRKDTTIIKVIVHLIFLLDTVQTILTMDDAFFWFAYNFGDLNKVYEFHLAAIDIPTLDAVIALIVQLVYCWRIWVLSEWRIIPILTGFLALLAAACGMASGIRDFQLQNVLHLDENYLVPIRIWLFGSAVTDIVIASSMAYILLRVTKEPGAVRASTGRRIMRLLTLTLETNAITAAVAIETVVIFFIKPIAPPVTNIYEPGGYLLGKLYSNCFMILLNQRHHHSSNTKTDTTLESGTMPTYSIELSTMATSSSASRGGTNAHQPQTLKALGSRSKTGQSSEKEEGKGATSEVSLNEIQFSKAITDVDTRTGP